MFHLATGLASTVLRGPFLWVSRKSLTNIVSPDDTVLELLQGELPGFEVGSIVRMIVKE